MQTDLTLARKNNVRRTLSTGVFVFLVGVLAVWPLIAIVVLSLDVSGVGEPYRFGLDAWRGLLGTENARAFGMSLLLALRVPVALAISVVLAWFIVRVRVYGSAVFEAVFWFSYFLPLLPMVASWSLLLDEDYGLLNTWAQSWGFAGPLFDLSSAGGIMWVHLTIQSVPILVILLTPTLRMIDRSLEDAANLSGASAGQSFIRVVLPLSIPAMGVAAIASGIKALESFEVEQVLGVPEGITVFSTRIYELVQDEVPHVADAMALSLVLVVFLIILAVLHQRYQRSAPQAGIAGDRFDNSTYSPKTKRLGAVILGLYVFVTILLPLLFLVWGSFMKLFGFFNLSQPWTFQNWSTVLGSDDFWVSVSATLRFGFVTAALGAVIYTLIAWIIPQLRDRLGQMVSLMCWLPWAFPGIVLGVGVMQLILEVPGFIVLQGSIVPVIFAFLVRELPIGVHMMQVSMSQTNQDMMNAARLFPARAWVVFRKIVAPLNLPAMMVVFLLVFSATLRDISTLVLIAPPDFQTLSLLVFKYALISEFEAASVVGTLIALISLAIAVATYKLAQRGGYFR